MKKIIHIVAGLLLLAATAVRAQPPRIDSMFTDEVRHQLLVFGDFGSTPGTVTIDSVPMHVTEWYPQWLRCDIPDSGRGWCGDVVIGARGYRSAPAALTGYKVQISCEDDRNRLHSGGSAQYQQGSSATLYLRFSIASILARGMVTRIEPILRQSSLYGSYWYSNVNVNFPEQDQIIQGMFKSSIRDSLDFSLGGHVTITFRPDSGAIYFDVPSQKYPLSDSKNEMTTAGTIGFRASFDLEANDSLHVILFSYAIVTDAPQIGWNAQKVSPAAVSYGPFHPQPSSMKVSSPLEDIEHLWPTPCSQTLHVLKQDAGGWAYITITDQLGRTCHSRISMQGNEQELNVSHLASGVYFLHVATEHSSEMQAFTVMR